MKKFTFLLLTYIITANLSFANISVIISQEEADKAEIALKTAENASDSIRILYDVYDLSDSSHRPEIGFKILDIATRTNDREVVIELLNQLAITSGDSDDISRLLKISNNLPETNEKKSIELALQMESARKEADGFSEKDRDSKTLSLVKTSRSEKGDIYEEILDLYRTMSFLGASSQGPLYLTYITRLGDLVNQLPEEDYSIKNLYYATASIYYTRTRNYEKALESCRELLNIIQKLEKKYIDSGREYANFDYLYYVLYRRMLQNYRGLNHDEIEDLYSKVLQLAENNEEIRESFDKRRIASAYYYMGTKQYDKALPEIEKALSNSDLSRFRRQELTGMKAYSLSMLGRKSEELEALEQYVLMLVAERKERLDETYKELEIRNAVNHMTAEERAAQQKEIEENRSMRKVAITLVYVMAVVLIFLVRSYFRLKNKVRELESRNHRLHTNIEQIFDNGKPFGTSDVYRHHVKLKG